MALFGATMFLDGYGPKREQPAASAAVSAAVKQGKGQDVVMHGDIRLNFDEVQNSCENLLKGNVSGYPFSKYVDTVTGENNKAVMLIWPPDNTVTEEDDVRYTNELIRAFNGTCAEQDSPIAVSSEGSYGDLYRKYAVNIQVFCETDILEPDKYLVNMTIPTGSNQAVVPLSQYDGVNEVIPTNGSVKVSGDKHTDDRTGLYNGK